jgi:acyl carrier protein
MNVQERVRQFIIQNFYVSDPSELTDDASLIGGGWVDSTGMLEVMSFIETEFGVRIADSEMVPENLDSVSKIAGFVAKKSPGARGATG